MLKKTSIEKDITRLERQLWKLKALRDYCKPRVRRFLIWEKIENISLERERQILEYEEKILLLEELINDLKE